MIHVYENSAALSITLTCQRITDRLENFVVIHFGIVIFVNHERNQFRVAFHRSSLELSLTKDDIIAHFPSLDE
ncbi:hypothetical protein HK105_205740 [Polyrhizophydium stewartii]|uniref:Uncharacterized protein n=1 Tax=Polyrhizophydium stewartii TaxID=2732419 RepID=A0ABR4N5I4_9FUNG